MQKILLTILIIFSLGQFSFGQFCGAGAPSDECATATPLDVASAFAGSTDCSYTVGVAPSSAWTGCGSLDNDSWFKFTAGATSLDIDWSIDGGSDCTGDAATTGVQFAIYPGNCLAAYTFADVLACLNPSGGIGSSGTFSITGLTVGDEYLLRIDGYAGDLCNYNITPQGGVAVVPANDDCPNAAALSCPSTVTGDNIFATAGDAPSGCTGGGTPQEGVWFTILGTGDDITLSTSNAGTSFDTELNVYTGSCASFTCVAGDDDGGTMPLTSEITFSSTLNETYYIYLDGASSATGAFELSVSCVTPCLADAGGAPTATLTGSGTNNAGPYVLCFNDALGVVAPGDEVNAPAASADPVDLGYAIYACAPTTNDPDTDPCWTMYHFTGDFTTTNNASSILATIIANPAGGAVPTNMLWFASVTLDDACFAASCANTDFGHDTDGDGCFDINIADAIQATFLTEITSTAVDNCPAGSVEITLNGGYPAANGSNYTITNTGAGSLSSTSATSGGSVTISGLASGDNWSIDVTDDNGCPVTFSASNFCPPTILISDPGPITTCGASFYDSGGATGNYSSNDNYTLTICPDVAGMALQVDFNSFETESCCDELTIYDGDDNTATSLGTFAGSYSSGTFTSSHCTGCLTFFFDADGSVVDEGFDASLSCVPQVLSCSVSVSGTSTSNCGSGTYDANVTVSYDGFDPAAGDQINVTIDGVTASYTPTSACPGTQVITVPGLLADGMADAISVVNSNDGGCFNAGSLTAPPTTCTTPVCGTSLTSPVCYVNGSLQEIFADICPDNPTDVVTFTFTAGSIESCCDEVVVYSGAEGSGTGGSLINNAANGSTDLAGATFTAAAGQCLTIYINADGSVNCSSNGGVFPAGDVTCAPPPPPTGCESNTVVMPICTDEPVSFAAGVNQTAASIDNPNVNYDCLIQTPNPAWYYLEVATSGSLSFDITNSNLLDVDWAAWGPFTDVADINANCATGTNAFATPLDCDYTTAGLGIINLGSVNVGEIYVVLVTNFSNSPTDISFSTTLISTASTNCDLIATCGPALVALAPSGTSTASSQCDDNDWTYYYDPAAPDDMLFAIEWAPDGSLSAMNSTAKSGASVDIVLGSMDSKELGPDASYAMARYWDVTASSIDEPVNVKFFYDPAEKTAVESAAQSYGTFYEGFKWFKTVSGTYNPSTNNTPEGVTGVIELAAAATGTENGVTYVQFDGIESFSGGTGAAGAGAMGVILPVELVSFSGYEKGAVNHLEWITASEKNTEWMVIERSLDGLNNWETVGEVPAYGTTSEAQYYSLEDTRPLELGYYRLKSIDFDGFFQLSNVISIRRKIDGFAVTNISPNPTKDMLNVGINTSTDGPTTLVVQDMTGRKINEYIFESSVGQNTFPIDMSAYTNGVYMLTIVNNEHQLVEKVVKQ